MIKCYPREQMRHEPVCVGRAGFRMTGEWSKKHSGQSTHAERRGREGQSEQAVESEVESAVRVCAEAEE